MRTKTLLTAVAALAAGITISKAQVYSANVVGYATIPTPSASTYYLISVPFNVGVSNGANEIFNPALPDASSILVWDATIQNYITYVADSTSPSGWDDGNFNPLAGSPVLPVGQGFFLNPASANLTNTFSGAVAVNVGTSNQMVLNNASSYYLISSVVPYSGFVTNGSPSGGGANLNNLPDATSILIWDASVQNYVTYVADSTSPSGWDDGNFNPLPAPPTLGVGQSFFINLSAGPYTWTTGL